MITPPLSHTATPFAMTVWQTGSGQWAITVTGAGTQCAALAPTVEEALTKLSDDLQYIVLHRVSRLRVLDSEAA